MVPQEFGANVKTIRGRNILGQSNGGASTDRPLLLHAGSEMVFWTMHCRYVELEQQ
jgi:hypothetical protein